MKIEFQPADIVLVHVKGFNFLRVYHFALNKMKIQFEIKPVQLETCRYNVTERHWEFVRLKALEKWL